MVSLTLERMARGGIRDQVGGGFIGTPRIIVVVPHFEKMLYDNAQLAMIYLDAWQLTQNPYFAQTARKTLDYVARDDRCGRWISRPLTRIA